MIRVAVWLAILTIASDFLKAQVTSTPDKTASCRQFAQAFYDWYVPLTQRRMNGPASDVALRRKADMFDPDLVRALKLDSEAQARAKSDLVGIDFDPFVGSQDPADHYIVRAVKWQGDKCSAEVWGASPPGAATQPDKPDVVAEVKHQYGHWQFFNFRYPELNTDLTSVLAQLRTQRQRNVRNRK